ncbi:GNAT family N-acetyltransferase [Streptacidiphilus sp. EB129]|uniref:GNAT family N-acetyltransferase n=1 Tax=Streptacidiphilus sp. EB129 TaxID=3156262 RepID=UPI0035155BFD
MSQPVNVELRHYTDLTPVRQDIIDVYTDARAPLLHLPHYAVERFAERLDRHAGESGWETVIAYDTDQPVGYAYVNTLIENDRWWSRMTEPLPDSFTDISTAALKEIMVRTPWRGTGTALRIHDALLSGRTEERVTLSVNPLAGDGKVQALYVTWGYEPFNEQRPSPDSPSLTAMIRSLKHPHVC